MYSSCARSEKLGNSRAGKRKRDRKRETCSRIPTRFPLDCAPRNVPRVALCFALSLSLCAGSLLRFIFHEDNNFRLSKGSGESRRSRHNSSFRNEFRSVVFGTSRDLFHLGRDFYFGTAGAFLQPQMDTPTKQNCDLQRNTLLWRICERYARDSYGATFPL